MRLNTKWLFTIFICICIATKVSSLESCASKDVTKLQLCTLEDAYDTSLPSEPWPVTVKNSVTVLDVVELNPDDNTLTIFVQLKVLWNDTGLSLISNDPNE